MAETQAQIRVLQTNSTDTMVHVIDPATNAIVGEIRGIPVAHGVAAAPNGSRIYVSGEAETALKVIDARTLAIIKTIPLSARPNNIAITPDGKKKEHGANVDGAEIEMLADYSGRHFGPEA